MKIIVDSGGFSGGFIEMLIIVDGVHLREYQSNTVPFVEGTRGKKWKLAVRNTCRGRIKFIPTVDGLNVCDASSGKIDPKAPGYILEGNGGNILIPGFKLSGHRTANEFVFESPEESYTAKMGGGTTNTGIIGMAVFAEASRPLSEGFSHLGRSPRPGPDKYQAALQPMSTRLGLVRGMTESASPQRQCAGLGTGMGEPVEFKTQGVDFESGQFLGVMTLRYASARVLKQKYHIDTEAVEPDAFPAGSLRLGNDSPGCPLPPGVSETPWYKMH